MCSFNSKFINSQFATLDNMENFPTEIAAARTFVFVREVMPLLQMNLIKGGDLDNAIVIYDTHMEQADLDRLADAMGVAHKPASELGYINNKPLVYNNEPARHKLLDFVGDIRLAGPMINGHFSIYRPGHKANNAFARFLSNYIKDHPQE